MRPSHKWFPMNLQEQAAWFANFNYHIQRIGASFGLSPAELASVADDAENIKFLARAMVSVNAYTDAIIQYRKIFTEGDFGDPTPGFPADPGLVLPHPSQPAGAFMRLDAIVRRIRVHPTFTESTASLLDIVPRQRELAAADEAPPKLKATVEPGNEIVVTFIRGRSHGIYIETNIDEGGWMFAEKLVRSPGAFTVPSNEAHTPRGVQLRARYLDGNDPVGLGPISRPSRRYRDGYLLVDDPHADAQWVVL